MSGYELYLVLHIGGAIAWVGAAFVMVIFGTRANLDPDARRAVSFGSDAEWLGLRLYVPANLLVLASGFLVVEEGGWGYGQLWIKLGFAGFAVSFAMGAAFFAPGWSRVASLAEQEGDDSAAVRATVRRLLLGSWIDLGLLLAIVFVMTVKPKGDDVGALVVTAVIPLAFAFLGLVLGRTNGRHTSPAPPVAQAR